MPSMYLFEKQSKEYQNEIIPRNIKNMLAIEASEGTHYYKYISQTGRVYNITKFGASAPGEIVMEKYGFSVKAVCKEYLDMVKENRK